MKKGVIKILQPVVAFDVYSSKINNEREKTYKKVHKMMTKEDIESYEMIVTDTEIVFNYLVK